MTITKEQLVRLVHEAVKDLMVAILAAYEPLTEAEWIELTHIAFHDARALPDPTTYHQVGAVDVDDLDPMDPKRMN